MREANCEILVGRARIEHAPAPAPAPIDDDDGDGSMLCPTRRYFRSSR
ncbi:MAG: hypothetical protein AB9872_05615 [Solidesulfovibrio sp.]